MKTAFDWDKEKDTIRTLYESGWTYKQIGDKYQVADTTIMRRVKKTYPALSKKKRNKLQKLQLKNPPP